MTIVDIVIHSMQAAWLWLATTVHPLAPWVAMVGLVFAALYAVRKWAPGVWQWAADKGPIGVAASKCFQALPSVLLGALIVSISTGADVKLTVIGAVTALAAPLGHEVLKWASSKTPGPTYLGGSWPAAGSAPKPPSIGPAAIVLAVLLLTGCTGSLQGAKVQGQRMRAVGTLSTASVDRCESLDSQYRVSGFLAKTSALLATGATAAVASGQIEDDRVNDGLTYSAIGTAALAGGLVVYQELTSESYVRECSQ